MNSLNIKFVFSIQKWSTLIIIAQKGCTCNSKASDGSVSSCLGWGWGFSFGFGFDLGSDLGIFLGFLLCTLDNIFIVFLENFLGLLFHYLLVVNDLVLFTNFLVTFLETFLATFTESFLDNFLTFLDNALTFLTDLMVLIILMLVVLMVIFIITSRGI
jgi:hypothetical protein